MVTAHGIDSREYFREYLSASPQRERWWRFHQQRTLARSPNAARGRPIYVLVWDRDGKTLLFSDPSTMTNYTVPGKPDGLLNPSRWDSMVQGPGLKILPQPKAMPLKPVHSKPIL